MSSLNKVQLIGNVGADPEIRTMQSGDEIATFSLATSESWKDKRSGERQTKTQWHKIVVFNQSLVSLSENYISKGTKLFLEGQIETRKWTDNNGIDRYATEIVLRPFGSQIILLGGRQDGDAPENDRGQSRAGTSNSAPSQSYDDFADEIPF